MTDNVQDLSQIFQATAPVIEFPDYALSSADLVLYKKGTSSVFQGVRHGAQQGSVSEGAERAAVS